MTPMKMKSVSDSPLVLRVQTDVDAMRRRLFSLLACLEPASSGSGAGSGGAGSGLDASVSSSVSSVAFHEMSGVMVHGQGQGQNSQGGHTQGVSGGGGGRRGAALRASRLERALGDLVALLEVEGHLSRCHAEVLAHQKRQTALQRLDEALHRVDETTRSLWTTWQTASLHLDTDLTEHDTFLPSSTTTSSTSSTTVRVEVDPRSLTRYGLNLKLWGVPPGLGHAGTVGLYCPAPHPTEEMIRGVARKWGVGLGGGGDERGDVEGSSVEMGMGDMERRRREGGKRGGTVSSRVTGVFHGHAAAGGGKHRKDEEEEDEAALLDMDLNPDLS